MVREFSEIDRFNINKNSDVIYLSILYTLAVSPSLEGSRQHKRNSKNNGGFIPFF